MAIALVNYSLHKKKKKKIHVFLKNNPRHSCPCITCQYVFNYHQFDCHHLMVVLDEEVSKGVPKVNTVHPEGEMSVPHCIAIQ